MSANTVSGVGSSHGNVNLLTLMQPPYAPTTAVLGGTPDISTDVPICAVFIALYLSCAATSSTIFLRNRKQQHKFMPSLLFSGFCMARVATCVLRIAWATRQSNVSLGIAATLFTNLGVFVLYILNLLFAQRILRARRPTIGWHFGLKVIVVTAYTCIGIAAALVISFTILSYYTRDLYLLQTAVDVQKAAATYLMVFVVLPFVLLLVAYVPGLDSADQQSFGRSSMTIKTLVALLLVSLMTLDQGYHCGIVWISAKYPASNPPWYDSRTCFYAFGFMLEILYVLSALALRIDLKFHVPNGSSQRKTYVVFGDGKGSDSMQEYNEA